MFVNGASGRPDQQWSLRSPRLSNYSAELYAEENSICWL